MGYVLVPNEVADNPNLQGYPIAVYVAIRRYCDGATDVAWPSLSELVDRTQLSINTIRKAISDLEAAGALMVESRGRQRHQYRFPAFIIELNSLSPDDTDNPLKTARNPITTRYGPRATARDPITTRYGPYHQARAIKTEDQEDQDRGSRSTGTVSRDDRDTVSGSDRVTEPDTNSTWMPRPRRRSST